MPIQPHARPTEFPRCLSLVASYLSSISPLLVVHSIQVALFRLQDCSWKCSEQLGFEVHSRPCIGICGWLGASTVGGSSCLGRHEVIEYQGHGSKAASRVEIGDLAPRLPGLSKSLHLAVTVAPYVSSWDPSLPFPS